MHPVLAMQVSYCSGHAGLIGGVPRRNMLAACSRRGNGGGHEGGEEEELRLDWDLKTKDLQERLRASQAAEATAKSQLQAQQSELDALRLEKEWRDFLGSKEADIESKVRAYRESLVYEAEREFSKMKTKHMGKRKKT
jgi:hypothetical protein